MSLKAPKRPQKTLTAPARPIKSKSKILAQESLFEVDEDWKKEWVGMPEFSQKDLKPFKSVHLHFACLEDILIFGKLIDQTVTLETRSIWFPAAEIGRYANKRWKDEGQNEETMEPV